MPKPSRPAGPPGPHGPHGPRGPILANFAFVALARAMQMAAGFAILVMATRVLSLADFGRYGYATALSGAVMALSYFGVQQVMIRRVAADRHNAPAAVGAAIVLRLGLAALAGLALWVVAAATGAGPDLRLALFLAYALELARTMGLLASAVFQARERMAWEPVLSLVQSLASLGLAAAALALGHGLTGLLAALALALTLHALLAWTVAAGRFIRPSFALSGADLRAFLSASAVIGLGIFFHQNLFRLGTMLLEWIKGPEEVALFQAPHDLILKIEAVPQALMLAVYPALTRLLPTDPEAARVLYRTVFRHVLYLGAWPALLLGLFADQVAPLLFGPRFAASGPVLAVVAAALVPLALDMLLNNLLIAMDRQRYALYYAAAALAVNAGLGLALIPRLGPVGAALAALCGYLCLLLFSAFFAARQGIRPGAAGPLFRLAPALAAAAAAAYGARGLFGPALLPGTLAVTVAYFGLLLALGAFPASDFRAIKALIRPASTPLRRTDTP